MARGPTAAEHYAQSQNFDAFYQHLGGNASAWPQWAAVVLFYIAVHEIQAFLVARGHRPTDHTSRKAVLNQGWQQLATLYAGLYDLSKKARYECITPSQAQLTLAEMQLQLVRQFVAQQGGQQPPY